MLRAVRMVGTNLLTTSYDLAYECLTPNSIYMHCIRWKRKPIWLPTAKTKVFRIPKRPEVPVEELEEMKRLNNHYRTYMKSIKKHIKLMVAESEIQYDEEVVRQAEEIDFERCNAINEEWNQAVAQQREKRLMEEREAQKTQALENLMSKEEKVAMLKRQIEEEVKLVEEALPTFITPENIDQAIQEVLATTVNYNAIIDLDGKWYPEQTQNSEQGGPDDSHKIQVSG